MTTLHENEILKWGCQNGIEVDAGYPQSAILSFKSAPDLKRFWVVPREPERRSYFLAVMLHLLGEWQSCYVWRHLGSWPEEAYPNPNARVEFQILKGIGLPMGTAAIVQFDQAEVDPLLTLLFSTTVFGWSVGEDLYVVPDHAQQIMRVSHHDVVHVAFRQVDDLQRFVHGMTEEKFPLPDHVPDATFKVPDWMKRD